MAVKCIENDERTKISPKVDRIYDYMVQVASYCNRVGKEISKDDDDYEAYKKAYNVVAKALADIAGILS